MINITNHNDNNFLSEINKKTLTLQSKVKEKELDNFLSGEADSNNCFLEIHSGAGGVEAQDWVEMLVRMYTRWSESKNFAL